jgi:inorganic pyrophosphatase
MWMRSSHEHYKDLEAGKWVLIEGWLGIGDGQEEIHPALTVI